MKSAIVAVALLLSGCAVQISGTPRAEPPDAQPPHVQSTPHVFPILAQFKEVDAKQFSTMSRGGPLFQFSTTVGVQCRITVGAMSCGGRFSAEPYSAGDNPCASVGSVRADGSSPDVYQIDRSDGTCKATAPRDYPRLEADHKMVLEIERLNVRTFICAVGPPERIACIHHEHDEDHGYVIEPTGAWTF